MKISVFLSHIEAIAAEYPRQGNEARAYLVDNPLTYAEAGKAEQEGLTQLEYRLYSELGTVEDLFDQKVVGFAKAEPILYGMKKGQKSAREAFKEEHGFYRYELPDKMVDLILGGETYTSAMHILNMPQDRSFFRGNLSKKSIMAKVNWLKSV